MRVVWVRFNRKEKFVLLAIAALLLLGGGAARAFILGGSPQPSTAIDLQKGLVGWWKLDGNAKDSTPYANDATVNGATATTDREGRANSAYSFNGSTNYIETNSAVSTPGYGTDQLSVCAWAKGTFNQSIVRQQPTSGSFLVLDWNSSSRLDIMSWDGGVGGGISSGIPNDNAWHQTCMVWKRNTTNGFQAYVDGQLVAQRNSANVAIPNLNSPIDFGRYPLGGEYDTGSIDDVRIYNRALSATEETALYKEYNPGLAADSGQYGLVGWWKMENNIKDSTPYASTGTLHGATLTTDREGQSNSAYSLAGTTSYIGLGNSSNYQITSGTVSAWVKAPSPGSSYRGVVVKQLAYGMFLINGFVGAFDWNTGTPYTSTANAADGKWHLLTYTFKNGVAGGSTLYMDGSSVLTITNTVTAQTAALTLGAGTDSGSLQNLAGSIDDARIYNRVLSAAEVSNLYNSYNSQISLYDSSSPAGTVNLGQGLVGEWDMHGNAKDATPNADDGVVTNATLTTDREGRANSAYSFNGTNTSIMIPDSDAFNMTNLTIAAWVKLTSTNLGNHRIIYQQDSDFWYMHITTNTLTGYFSLDSIYGTSCGPSLNDGKWHHLAISRVSGGVVTWWIDGASVCTYPAGTGQYAINAPIYIGSQAGTSQFLVGDVSDVRIYNRALSTAEMSALYRTYR